MKKTLLIIALALAANCAFAQMRVAPKLPDYEFTTVKANPITSVKNQNNSGTCWAYSTIGFFESEAIRLGKIADTLKYPDFSEFFVVSHSYYDRAVKYVRLDGNLTFGAGSEADDVLDVIRDYGIVPNEAMTGMNYGTELPVQGEMDAVLKGIVQAVAKNPNRTLSSNWKKGFVAIVDTYLGECPETFTVDDSLDGEINAFLNVKIPPYPIWKVLTKEERHKFFLTNSIALDEDDWQMRKKKLKPSEITEFDSALANPKFTRKMEKHTPYGSVTCIVVYGSVYRTETCAAEIFNECFGNDKRKTMFRINEVLSTLEGWELSENRSKDFHDCYGDQRRIYSRKEIPVDLASKEKNLPADMSIDDTDLPF